MPERLNRKVIYESDYVCLYADKVKLSNGYIIEKYHRIHYPQEARSIVVFNENDEVLLIQSKRYTVMRLEWEIPAGRIKVGESKEEAARRECMEETGCTVKDLKFYVLKIQPMECQIVYSMLLLQELIQNLRILTKTKLK